ncbi:MAG: hypothetical protein WDN25_22490 [Acetobacteraceae bacterium]
MKRAALAAIALLLTAQAPDRPTAQPIRDVTVEYTLQDARDPNEVTRDRPLKVYWAKGGARMRIEMGDERSYVVLDRDSRRMMMVLLDERGYVEVPFDPQRPTGFTVPPDLALVRGRNEIIVGNPCTLWYAKRGEGGGSLCVTDDGVLLRADGYGEQRRGNLVATSVVYGPQPASVFAPPAGFRKLDITRRPAPASPDARKPG